jgi:hypothetical protein
VVVVVVVVGLWGRGGKLGLLTSTDESYSKHRRGQAQSVGEWRPGRGLWVYVLSGIWGNRVEGFDSGTVGMMGDLGCSVMQR